MCEEYESIANKALATPANTEQLMELKNAIIKVREGTIFELEERILKAKKRLEFLVDYTSMSPAEMRLNSEAFNWHSRMPPIFEEHDEIIGASKRQAENALKVHTHPFFMYPIDNIPFLICIDLSWHYFCFLFPFLRLIHTQ